MTEISPATEISQLTAQMLRQGRRGPAEWVCSRLEAAEPPSDSLAASTRYGMWIQQVESHIHTLAACIAYRSPALLDEYVRWASSIDQRPVGCLANRPWQGSIETRGWTWITWCSEPSRSRSP